MDNCWATKSEGVGLVLVLLVSKISNQCDPDPPTSDGQRDDYMLSQYCALHCSAPCGKKKFLKSRTHLVEYILLMFISHTRVKHDLPVLYDLILPIRYMQ